MTEPTTKGSVVNRDPSAGNVPDDHDQIGLQIVVFELAGHLFGIDVDRVFEIVRQVEVTDMPGAPEYVEGIIEIREAIIPLVSLQRLLGVGRGTHDLTTQVIVVRSKSGIFGLLVDTVSDIASVKRQDVMAPNKAIKPFSKCVTGVAELGESLVLLLDVDMLSEPGLWGTVTPKQRSSTRDPECDAATRDKEKQILRQRALEIRKKSAEDSFAKRRLVSFSIGEEWYGTDIACVKEISKATEIYFIPSAPAHIKGTINLRGVIVPVVDLAKVLGLQVPTNSEMEAIVVIEQDQNTIGLLVGRVDDVVDVASESIEPPLTTIDGDRLPYFEGQLEWTGKLLGLLKMDHVVRMISEHIG
jgi:purine-binding chemotaxis protein CheW